MNCTSQAANSSFRQIRARSIPHPHLLPQLLDGSGFEFPTHNVESENTWTVILINSAAGWLSNVILNQRNVFQSVRYLHMGCIFALSVYTCRCTDCMKSCLLGKLLFVAIRLKRS